MGKLIYSESFGHDMSDWDRQIQEVRRAIGSKSMFVVGEFNTHYLSGQRPLCLPAARFSGILVRKVRGIFIHSKFRR
jgi:hypothetical protein